MAESPGSRSGSLTFDAQGDVDEAAAHAVLAGVGPARASPT